MQVLLLSIIILMLAPTYKYLGAYTLLALRPEIYSIPCNSEHLHPLEGTGMERRASR